MLYNCAYMCDNVQSNTLTLMYQIDIVEHNIRKCCSIEDIIKYIIKVKL